METRRWDRGTGAGGLQLESADARTDSVVMGEVLWYSRSEILATFHRFQQSQLCPAKIFRIKRLQIKAEVNQFIPLRFFNIDLVSRRT